MYFDRRLWQLTRGLRGWIALAILLGLVASVVGIARFAILGVLLSHVFDGAGFVAIAIPAVGVAVAVLLRGVVDHHRAMISHRTATRVQEDLRGRLYDKIAALGPGMVRRRAHRRGHAVGRRWGRAAADLFRPVCPAGLHRGADAAGDLRLHRLLGRAGRGGDAGLRARDLDRAGRLRAARAPLQPRAPGRSEVFRLGVSRRRPGPADLEGIRSEPRLWTAARRQSAGAVRPFAAGIVDGRDDPRHHRLRGGDRRCVGLGPRRLAGLSRPDEHRGIADRADGRHRGLPPVARFAHGAASGDARAIGRRRHQCAARRRTLGPRAAARPAGDQPAAPPDHRFRGRLVRLSRRARRRP